RSSRTSSAACCSITAFGDPGKRPLPKQRLRQRKQRLRQRRARKGRRPRLPMAHLLLLRRRVNADRPRAPDVPPSSFVSRSSANAERGRGRSATGRGGESETPPSSRLRWAELATHCASAVDKL